MKKNKQCVRCNYEWVSRVDDPVECPNCKHRKWGAHQQSMQ